MNPYHHLIARHIKPYVESCISKKSHGKNVISFPHFHSVKISMLILNSNSSPSIKGKWTGTFTYGPEFGRALYGQSERFILELKDEGNGRFTGKCVEYQNDGESSIAVVEGMITMQEITFHKQYIGE